MAKYEYHIGCLCHLSIFSFLGSAGSQPMRRGSCVTLSTQQLKIQNLVGYEKQRHPVEAIMFITRKGIKICTKPDLKWVRDAMKKLDQKHTTKRK
ncbi:XCL2 protein, partial [Hemiprocne comata]|nr:XCL2 protein [Hemiprocne comata]